MTRTFAALSVAAMLALCLAIRFPTMTRHTGAPNLEASYHVLLTVTALRESPLASHWLLPTVSLGRPIDKSISWGATIPTPGGDYIYTSFPAPGFLAPLGFFQALGLEASMPSLMAFNFLLQVAACALLYALLIRLLASQGIEAGRARLAAVLGVSVQVFAAEAMLSFGLVYWSQQLFQVLLLASLLVLVEVLRRNARECRGLVAGLALLTALGAWTEWTGFVLNSAIVLLLLLRSIRERQYLPVAVAVALATLAAGAVILCHYALVLGLDTLWRTMAWRAAERSASTAPLLGLPWAYLKSYGLILPVAAAAAVLLWKDHPRSDWWKPGSAAGLALLCSVLVLVENLLLAQHAVQFSFDRLKAAVPLAILVALGAAHLGRRQAAWGAGLLAVALLQNLVLHHVLLGRYAAWRQVDAANDALVREVAALVDLSCADLSANTVVRGYFNLAWRRGIRELTPRATFDQFGPPGPGPDCGSIHVEAVSFDSGMPRFLNALVRRDGAVSNLEARAMNQP